MLDYIANINIFVNFFLNKNITEIFIQKKIILKISIMNMLSNLLKIRVKSQTTI